MAVLGCAELKLLLHLGGEQQKKNIALVGCCTIANFMGTLGQGSDQGTGRVLAGTAATSPTCRYWLGSLSWLVAFSVGRDKEECNGMAGIDKMHCCVDKNRVQPLKSSPNIASINGILHTECNSVGGIKSHKTEAVY